jgi:hypothetical protein
MQKFKNDRDRDKGERERHPILSLDAENRKMAHKPIAHQAPPRSERLQPDADRGLTGRAEPAREMGSGFGDSPLPSLARPLVRVPAAPWARQR